MPARARRHPKALLKNCSMNYLMNDLQAGVLLGVAGSCPATNCGVTLRQGRELL